MQHLDEGTVHAWLDGALPEEEAARVERHAAECAECAALVAEARGLIAGAGRIVSSLDLVRGNVLPKQKPAAHALWNRLHLTPSRAALAATLLIAVASTLVIRHAPAGPQAALLEQARGVAASAASEPSPGVSANAPAAAPQTPAPSAATPPSAPMQLQAPASEGQKAQANTVDKKTLTTADSARSGAAARSSTRDAAGREVPAPTPKAEPTLPAMAAVKPPARAADRAFAAPRTDSATAVAGRAKDTATAAPVPAAAAQSAGAIARRALRPNDANPATQLPLTSAGRRINAGQPVQMSEVVATPTGMVVVETRCYMILPDNSDLARALPDRFALMVSMPDSAHVVRLVGADGKIGSVVPNAIWRPAGVSMTRVEFPATGGQFAPIVLTIRDGVLTVQASSASITRTVGIRPINCRE